MDKILVTTDGSKNATKAIRKTRELAEALNYEVEILSVAKDVITNPYLTIEYSAVQPNQKDFVKLAEDILEEALKEFDDFDGIVKTKLLRGDPAEMIVEETKNKDFELVVMGSRGLGTFSRTILGSVSHKVLNHVDTSVLIVK